jgi:hypothetical protein
MKKLFTILLFLTAFISNAQNLNKITGLEGTAASVAYSLRQLSTSYTGPLVRIKVGSNFYDVYPDVSTAKFSLSSKISAAIGTYNAGVAAASTNALSTIISGSTDATVAIWYDQSGNGVHVLSNTSTAKIITAGNVNTLYGQPTIYFSGTTGQSLLTSSNTVDFSALSGATVNAVAQNIATTSSFAGIIGAAYAIGSPGYNIAYDATIGKGYASDGAGCTYGGTSSSTSPQLVTNIFTNTTTNLSTTYINGVLKTPSSTSPCALTHTSGSKIYIGSARGHGPASFIGNISEAIIFPSQLSDAVRNPLETNQTQTYFGPAVTIASSASGAVCVGTSVTFTATTYNFTSTPTLQWYKNGTAISGETNATYTSTALSNNDVISVSATPVSVSATTVTSNLIANLDAGNSSSYNGSGNTWTDLTGNGNKVTLTNTGYSLVNGGGIALNTNGYGTQTLSNSPFNGDFTWSTIFRFNEGMWDWIYNVGGYNGLVLTTISKPALSWGGWFNNKIDAGAEASLINGNYYMLTFVRTGNAISCYLQARPYGVGSNVSGNITLVSPLIGKGPGGEAWPNGIVNLILLYNRALTQSEITQNYNTYAARFGLSAADISSNMITATITGSAPTLAITGDGCVNKTTLTTPSGASAYAWLKDNVAISNTNSSNYTPTTAGVYKVQVTSGSCSTTSTATTIFSCGNDAFGKMVALTNASSIISLEGGANLGTGKDITGKIYNTTNFTTTSGTVGSTTAVLGGVISATNAVTSSIGIMYSTDVNFGTYSTTTIQSNVTPGTYTSTISGLTSSTNYHAKSFIVNKAGTSYGSVVSFTTTPPTALDAIVLNLDATNNSSYSGSGSIWNDVSGQNNTATFTSTPTFSSNPGSLTFSTASYATTISSTINLTTATFIAWVNPSQIQSNYTGIIYLPKSSTDLNNRYGMQFRTNNSVGYTWGMNGATTYNWDSQLYTPNNQWSMVAISVSANSTTAYLCNASGITSAINTDTHAAASGFKYYVGRDPISYSSSEADLRTFKGKISRVSVYDATLTQSDITTIFNAQKVAFGIN